MQSHGNCIKVPYLFGQVREGSCSVTEAGLYLEDAVDGADRYACRFIKITFAVDTHVFIYYINVIPG